MSARSDVARLLPKRTAGQRHVPPEDLVEAVLTALTSAGWEPALHGGDSLAGALEAARLLLAECGVAFEPPAVVGADLLRPCEDQVPGDLPCGGQVTLGLDPTGGVIATCHHGHTRWVAVERT